MKHSYILSLTVGLLVATGLVGCQAAPDDNKSLQGTWTLVSGEKDGEPLPEQDIKNSKLTIAGDTHTVQVGEMIIKGTHKLDATKKPKQIDLTYESGPNKGKTLLGIYELEGDESEGTRSESCC
jgi:uncharacterized protein (TIGR03067 family)